MLRSANKNALGSEKFSIIMPAYNAAKTITDSINSVLAQTLTDFKLYIVNDNSQDATESIIHSFSDDRIVYLKNESNLGVASSRNKALEVASGKYVAFLDSDDLWDGEKLEKQEMIFDQGWDVVCSHYITFSDLDRNKINNRKSPEVITYNDMLKSNFIGNLTGAYNMQKIGKIYQKKIGHEDYVMWLYILNKVQRAYCIQESLASYRLSTTSISGNKFKAARWQWNIYREELDFSVSKSAYYFLQYMKNALKKRG
ncbi:putative teichuronic acid biosynthesis glycosyltransferase TuaG [Enterobacterales bacterium 8AC]|nr:putative teichuronic acid biosynthesis glycosyltransferase TuaG [Enterobacterales bacterium 8AC]